MASWNSRRTVYILNFWFNLVNYASKDAIYCSCSDNATFFKLVMYFTEFFALL